MTALRKSETRKLIASLEAQGCRIEWATVGNRGVGRVGRFPVKVWPPNKDRHFILLHDTVSSPNDVTVKRTEVMRAGLTWPFDDKKATKALEKNSRKEQQMTSTDAAVEAVQSGEPMQHVQVPPSVAKRPHPPEVKSIQAIEPYLNGMPPTFWTDELVSRLMADNVSGYRNKHSGTQAAQSLLDWLGWRVVEAKRNRNGYSYRWVKDPNAVVLPGITAAERVAKAAASRYGKATVTPIRANGESVHEVSTNVGTALQEALLRREAEASTALDKGDHDGTAIALDPVEAQAKGTLDAGERRLHHDRKQCATCNRWYTPEGYERHIEETQHGAEPEAVPQGNERIEVSPDGNLRDLVVSGNGRGETPYTIGFASDTVAKADYDALEAMALENERKLAEAVHGKDEVIAQRDELNARLSEVERERDQWHDAVERTAAEIVQLRSQVAGHRDDGSWLLEDDVLDGDMTLIELAANARRMGVTLEIRVRRA